MNKTFFDSINNSLDSIAKQKFDDLAKYQLRKAMEKCKMVQYPETDDIDGIRASGECICNICGKEYYDHPYDWRIIGYGGVPYLNIICDGTRVKL